MPVISVEDISKAYRIGVRQETPDTLVGAAKRFLAAPFRNARNLRRLNTAGENRMETQDSDTLWALRNVSFKINQGDVVGILGRNGAGKSTILKILSRISAPTSGRVVIKGRINSLLEVGTGFHPELTGRENVYMNGTILGMTKKEIDSKFDEIVEFSGVEKFLETPTKRYSSGMQVRLAFAVAAHLEPEILIIDEVLAVGDASFQKKCLGKMREVAGGGRTVIFVSHNLSTVRMLCRSGIVLQSGTVKAAGTVDEAIRCYMSSIQDRAETDVASRNDRGGNGKAKLIHASPSSHNSRQIATGSPISFRFVYQSSLPNIACVFTIYDERGESILSFCSASGASDDEVVDADGNQFVCNLSECPLMPGQYRINVALQCGDDLLDHVEGATVFSVEDGMMRGRAISRVAGVARLAVPHQWIRSRV